MATIDYPSTLPSPQLAGNSMTAGSTFKTSEFDFAVRNRKSYCSAYYVSFNFVATSDAQMKLFKDFYYTTLNKGVATFNADWTVEGDSTTKEFRFADVYSASGFGNSNYNITATFQMMTRIADL